MTCMWWGGLLNQSRLSRLVPSRVGESTFAGLKCTLSVAAVLSRPVAYYPVREFSVANPVAKTHGSPVNNFGSARNSSLSRHLIGHPCPPSRPTRSAISSSTRRSDRLRCWGLCCLGCVMGMMSLVEATSMSRRTRMAPCCIGPENFRGAMIIWRSFNVPAFRQCRLTRDAKRKPRACRGFKVMRWSI